MSLQEILHWLLPYTFSPFTVVFFVGVSVWYLRGVHRLKARGEGPGIWRQISFWVGLVLCYAVLHTAFDYYAQYMFFMHRIQHLVLHHLGAFLIALGNPLPAFRAGAPSFPGRGGLEKVLTPVARFIQHPFIAAFLFVGLIFFWLIPELHFEAMLSHERYMVMNWSMFLDGVLFWLLILDPRPPRDTPGMPGYGTRFAMLWGTAFPQIILGAWITLSSGIIYDVYSVCGRAWPMSAETDQVLGGVFTWIPPGMMTVLASLLVLRLAMRDSENRQAASDDKTGEQ
jgi:putative membrane protein